MKLKKINIARTIEKSHTSMIDDQICLFVTCTLCQRGKEIDKNLSDAMTAYSRVLQYSVMTMKNRNIKVVTPLTLSPSCNIESNAVRTIYATP